MDPHLLFNSDLLFNPELQFHYNDEFIFFSKSFLSQWYGAFRGQESNFITYCGNRSMARVNCAEQAMMLQKAYLFQDFSSYDKILKKHHPKDQKQLGRQVSNFDQDIWEKNRFDLVTKINIEKFSQNIELQNLLLSTEDKKLVEAAPWDKIWGIGMGVEDPDIVDPKNWLGKNLLGHALMVTRDYLKLILQS